MADRARERRYVEWCVLAVYAVLIALAISRHEPWRDEAQSWLIARDLSPLGVLRQMGYEGTPALWHFLVMPLAKLGLPFWTQNVLGAVVAVAVVAAVLFRAPFGLPIRILFAASYWMAWEYSVKARNYGIGLLFLFLAADSYRDRYERPYRYALWLGLLANASLFGLVFAFFLGLAFAIEVASKRRERRPMLACVMLAAFGLAAAAQMIAPPDEIHRTGVYPVHWFSFLMAPASIAVAEVRTGAGMFIFGLAGYALLGLVFVAIRCEPGLFFAVLASTVSLLAIFTFGALSGPRHPGMLLGLLLFALWIRETWPERGRAVRCAGIAVALALAASVPAGVRWLVADWTKPYAGARDMAAYIERHVPPDAAIAAHPGYAGHEILPYLPRRKIYFLDVREWGTFTTWRTATITANGWRGTDVLQRVTKDFPDRKPYLISLQALQPELGYRFVHISPGIAPDRETLYLYAPSTGP